MKIKLISHSKNDDFISILKGKKISNKYSTIFIKKLSDSIELEKFGRENYFLKKADEDIFIVEFKDSLYTSF